MLRYSFSTRRPCIFLRIGIHPYLLTCWYYLTRSPTFFDLSHPSLYIDEGSHSVWGYTPAASVTLRFYLLVGVRHWLISYTVPIPFRYYPTRGIFNWAERSRTYPTHTSTRHLEYWLVFRTDPTWNSVLDLVDWTFRVFYVVFYAGWYWIDSEFCLALDQYLFWLWTLIPLGSHSNLSLNFLGEVYTLALNSTLHWGHAAPKTYWILSR